jgi:glycosyltransferase involved in cell wall biosynthesis
MPNIGRAADNPKMSPRASGPLITVAICTHNRAAFLEKAVRSVLPQITDDTELLIIDNASIDDTPAVSAQLAAANSCVKVVREEELGLSAARNAALKNARGEFVLFLDDDATAETGWLAAYQRFLSAPPSEKIAAVGGAILIEFETPPSKRGDASVSFDCGNLPKCLPYLGSLFGGNIAYRRETALAAGMFDTRLGRKGEKRMSREESDLNLRLQDAGYEIWWLPGAAIWHFAPARGLKFREVMSGRFAEGRSVAIQRLKARRSGWDRESYRVVRIIGAPFHALAQLLAALIALPRNYQKAAEHVLQACRNCGIALEMLVRFKLD